ncbi:MAG TPA: chloride channel protein [Gemmatimonadales bacterium]|nr:chloride channel protein [Gemmatimonadales bacterium]
MPSSGPSLRPIRSLVRTRRATRLAARRALVGAEDIWDAFADWFNRLDLSENTILLGFAVVIGSAAALGVVVFYKAIDIAYDLLFLWTGTYLSRMGLLAYRPLLTAAGLATAWWIMRRLGRGHDGLNVPDVQLAVARRGGDLPARPAIARSAASAVTLGSGASAGSEGPVAVLGAAVGSFLGRLFHFDPQRVRVLVGAGAAAGISAAFNAPLAGAFFALEEILGSFAIGSFPPVVVASVLAAVVSHSFFGNNPAFPVPIEYGFTLKREVFLFYPLLGVVTGLISVLFIRVYFGIESGVKKLTWPDWLLPWLGGLTVGGLVVLSHGLLVGYGHFAMHIELFGRLPWSTLALLSLGSIVATSLTLNTGGSGGLFTPSLYVGATAGGAFGAALASLFPHLGLHPEAYALVGMGALVAGATGAPITGILLVFEMTNDYAIIVPLMLTTVTAFIVARWMEKDNLYSGWLRRRGENLEQGSDRDVLTGLKVADAYDPTASAVDEGVPVSILLDQLTRSDYMDLPVVDEERRLVGLITTVDLGRIAKDQANLLDILVAADVARPTETVTPEDSLLVAIRRMGVRGAGSIPVVHPNTQRLLGMLTRAHVLALYERAVASG